MKLSCLLLVAILLTAVAAVAQPTARELSRHKKEVAWSKRSGEAIISLDTLFRSGEPYALVRAKGKLEPSYQLVSLQGEPLFWVELNTNVPMLPGGPATENWRVYTFMIGEEVETAAVPLFLSFSRNDVAREIFRYGLIDSNGLNQSNVRAFLSRFGMLLPEPLPAEEVGPPQPNRDRNQPLYRKSKMAVFQDGVQIAVVWDSQKKAPRTSQARINLLNGRRCTLITYVQGATNSLEFETQPDGRVHRIEVGAQQDPVLEVAAYLVAKGYL